MIIIAKLQNKTVSDPINTHKVIKAYTGITSSLRFENDLTANGSDQFEFALWRLKDVRQIQKPDTAMR